MKRFLFILVLALALVTAVMAADSDWKLVFQDNFDRTQIGPDWKLVPGMSIVNGKLHMVGCVDAQPVRGFKSDVRLEFDAWAIDGIPPCDMSATLCGGETVNWGYLLGFGADWNHQNHLFGPGVWWEDKHPKFGIEFGKKYHCVAQKEGRQISYTINGIKIFDVRVDDPIGGPGFDRVGVLGWTGLDVDNVKIYERITPSQDTPKTPDSIPAGPLSRDGRKLVIKSGYSTPAMESAVAAFNSGKYDEALKQFRAMGNTFPGLLGQAYVLGDLGYVEKFIHPEFMKLADDFAVASKANPGDKDLEEFAILAKWFSNFRMQRNREASVAFGRFRALGPDNNPFYYKSRFYQARYLFWDGAEGGDRQMQKQACDMMDELKKTWPENEVLREFTGDIVPWGERLTADTTKNPAWAAYLREAYARETEFMHHFITERQSSDPKTFGGFGGGYGDDCEMMRTWMQIAAISSASDIARTGIENLAQGIWDNELKDGYTKGLSDVEHSSEPSSDMLPGMMILRWGDPIWVERNMRSMKTIKETYMGIDKLGYPRFKSSVYGGGQVETTVLGGGDSGYNARPMKHFLWAAWRGDNEAKDWFARWVDGWRAVTMSQDGDKIPGMIPRNIWYPSGSSYPPVKGATWYDENLSYIPRPDMITDAFLAAYSLTRDPKFLKPYQFDMSMGSRGPVRHPEHPAGSKLWQMDDMIGCSGNMWTEQCKPAVYHWLTGDTTYDDFIMAYGDSTQKYRVDGDLDAYMKSFQDAAVSLRGNLDLHTTEVLSTDRCGFPQALSIFGAYSGAMSSIADASTPSFSVTYDTPTTDFAALVTFCSTERLRVWLYNFDDKPMPVGMKLWRLKPGSYIINQGEEIMGERLNIHRYKWQEPTTVNITHKADGPTVMVPPGKVWCVDLRLDNPINVPATAPDMAIGKTDIAWVNGGLKVTVHNIGNADAKPFTVALQQQVNGAWKTTSEQTVSSLPVAKNFVPSTKTIAFKTSGKSGYRLAIDPSDKQYELCETNNVLTIN